MASMLSMSQLKNFTLAAADGEIGRVRDLYFDDDTWTVRYLVLDTGNWLPGRRVLVSPLSFAGIDADQQAIRVALTRQRVKDCPAIDTAKPVSRQFEAGLARHYGYPEYWSGPYRWGLATHPFLTPPGPTPTEREILAREEKGRDPHLRSAREVIDYAIEALDGALGHVEDFRVDVDSWAICYVVVDTRNWWPGRKVLVSPARLRAVNWSQRSVSVNLRREQIEDAPSQRLGVSGPSAGSPAQEGRE
jgi:hypothetical protein